MSRPRTLPKARGTLQVSTIAANGPRPAHLALVWLRADGHVSRVRLFVEDLPTIEAAIGDLREEADR